MVINLNSLGTVCLTTKRCLLRKFEYNDSYQAFINYLSNKEVAKYLTNDAHFSIYESEFLINNFINNYNNINYYNWAIINKVNNDIIGTITIHEIDVFNDKGEIGIIISPLYQKKGYAKEVVRAIIDFAFFNLKIHRLEMKILLNNISSNNLAKSLGFNYEGIIHSCVKKNNDYLDINLYYLINK